MANKPGNWHKDNPSHNPKPDKMCYKIKYIQYFWFSKLQSNASIARTNPVFLEDVLSVTAGTESFHAQLYRTQSHQKATESL